MNRTSLTIKEAEEMINNMYEKKWENCEVIDKNAKLMGNIDNLELSNLEKASIVLLNEELRLKQENQVLEKQLEQRDNIIKDVSDYINFLVIIDIRLACGRFKDTIWGKELLEILNIDKGE